MKPFDLQRAIAGDPVVTRDGRRAKFVAHVPESKRGCTTIAFVEGDGAVRLYYDNGSFCYDNSISEHDLQMAPKKKTAYVNLWPGRDGTTFGVPAFTAYWYETKELATEALGDAGSGALAVAVPVEIEE
jgi:hypothetical protein